MQNMMQFFESYRSLWKSTLWVGSFVLSFTLVTVGCGEPPHRDTKQSLTADASTPMPESAPDEDAGPDYTTPMPDYITPPMPDYVTPMPDYITPPMPDYTTPMPDYSTPPMPDYTTPMPDYSTPPTPDTITPMPDTTTPMPDTTPPMPDYGTDAGTPDYTTPTPDTTNTEIDKPKPDLRIPPPDRRIPPDLPRPDAVPEKPADVPVPDKEKLCCVCQYFPNKKCAALKQAACTKDRDCNWSNKSCLARHHKDCNDWIAAKAQDDCDEKKINTVWEDPTGGLKNCTRLRQHYEGHGLGCRRLTNRVKVCINKLPTCSRFDITDTGCSTFSSITDADKHMQTIIASLGGSQCATVSANQCTGNNSCQNRYMYTINSKTCTGKPDPCQGGKYCPGPGNVALCTEKGKNSVQVCCCDDKGKNCKWKAGTRSCK